MVDLRSLNTFNLPAQAPTLTRFTNVEQVLAFAQADHEAARQAFVLGGGSNVLFTQDLQVPVVQMAIPGITVLNENEAYVLIKVGAGVVWHELVEHTVAQGWGGLENLSLIWGWVGAAPMQNIGAYGVEVREVIEEVEVILLDGSPRLTTFSNEACRFGYRESIFKHELKGKAWIVSVTMRLTKEAHHMLRLSYGDIQNQLSADGVSSPTLADVSQAVIRIRSSKLPDPGQIGNAGSFFKNPELEAQLAATLLAAYPEAPHYSLADGRVKVPAGWLIEQAGWKGFREGDAGIHVRQALVVVNYGQASGDALWNLAQRVRADVEVKFGIALTPEVNVV